MNKDFIRNLRRVRHTTRMSPILNNVRFVDVDQNFVVMLSKCIVHNLNAVNTCHFWIGNYRCQPKLDLIIRRYIISLFLLYHFVDPDTVCRKGFLK